MNIMHIGLLGVIVIKPKGCHKEEGFFFKNSSQAYCPPYHTVDRFLQESLPYVSNHAVFNQPTCSQKKLDSCCLDDRVLTSIRTVDTTSAEETEYPIQACIFSDNAECLY